MSSQLRDLTIEDLDQILLIEQDLFGVTAWSRELFLDEISRLGSSRWYKVLCENDLIIGYVGMAITGSSADIQTIAVISEKQRAGHGAQLLELALAKAKELGVTQIFLEVAVENEAAIKLYQRFGFEQISIRPNYYGAGRNAYVMMRPIGAR